MNKNLKKAISSVAALALTATSVGIVSATTTLSDVSGTTYEAAINELTALEIVNGYEDGTFQPDKEVNRAEFSKMVVAMLNQLTEAEANTTVIFEDVTAGSYDWAIGYVAQAYQQGIVNGTNDAGTTFDPSKGVTYAEAMKMLVCAAGYENWSINEGGWPNGYLKYANNIGIGSGVSGVSNDTALNRGQCAQMIANALTAAICEVTGYTTDNGTQVATRQQQDGTDSKPFKSILTTQWKAYEVNGHVTGTHESGATDAGKVNYSIQKTKNYDDGSVVLTLSDTPYEISSVYDDTNDASSTLNQYSRAIISIDDSTDEEHILYIELAGRNVEQELDANNWYTLNFTSGTEGTIEFYKSSSSSTTTSYKLSKEAAMLVNNVEVPLTIENCKKYLEYNADVKCTLVDTPANGGTTDGKYDYVIVEYAAVAVVDELTEKTNEIRVNFDNYDATAIDQAYLSVDESDEDKVYTFVYNDAEVTVNELEQYDVLNLVFDPTTGINDSNFVKATITRNKVDGTCTSSGEDSEGDTYYTVAGTNYYMSNACTDALNISYTYTLYLDANGDIAKVEENQAAVNYAVVDKFYTSAGDDMVRLIDKTGEKKNYTLKEDKTDLSSKMNQDTTYYNDSTTAQKYGSTNVMPIADRVVDYSTNSSGEVTLKSVVSTKTETESEYKSASQKVGSVYVTDANIILNLSQYADNPTQTPSKTDMSYFINEMQYTVVFAGNRSSSDNSYPLVLIIEGNDGYTVETRMAIYKSGGTTQDDGQDKDQMFVYVNGEGAEYTDGTTRILCESGVVSGANLVEGDAIVYKTDSDGYVDEIVKITKMTTNAIANNRKNALNYSVTHGSKYPFTNDMITDDAQAIDFKGDGEVSFVFGPVTDKKSNSVDIVSVSNYISDETGDSYTYDTSACKYYQYDGNGRSGNFISVITASGVMKSTTPKTGYVNGSTASGQIQWDSDNNTVNYALLRLVDDDVVDVLSITEADGAANKSASVTAEPTATPEPTATAEPTATPTPTPEETVTEAPSATNDAPSGVTTYNEA